VAIRVGDAVREVQEHFSRLVAETVEKAKARGEKPPCRKGCSACCYDAVVCTRAEMGQAMRAADMAFEMMLVGKEAQRMKNYRVWEARTQEARAEMKKWRDQAGLLLAFVEKCECVGCSQEARRARASGVRPVVILESGEGVAERREVSSFLSAVQGRERGSGDEQGTPIALPGDVARVGTCPAHAPSPLSCKDREYKYRRARLLVDARTADKMQGHTAGGLWIEPEIRKLLDEADGR
jgi:hypothetical protein